MKREESGMATMTDILDQASDALLTRGDIAERFQDLRNEATVRASRLAEEAKRDGIELLALAARHGAEIARDFGLPLLTGATRRRRRHSAWKLWVAAAAVAAVAAIVVASSRE